MALFRMRRNHRRQLRSLSELRRGAVDAEDRNLPAGTDATSSGESENEGEAADDNAREDNGFHDGMVAGKSVLWGWFHHRPRLVIAMVLQLPVWLLWLAYKRNALPLVSWELVLAAGGIALFVPGAIHRSNWRQLLAMGLLGAIAPTATDWIAKHLGIPSSLALILPARAVMLAVLVGVAEWFCTRRRAYELLAWTTLACLTAAAVLDISQRFLAFSDRDPGQMGVLDDGGLWASATISFLMCWPLETLLIWLAVISGTSAEQPPTRRFRRAAAGVILGGLTFFVVTISSWCSASRNAHWRPAARFGKPWHWSC